MARELNYASLQKFDFEPTELSVHCLLVKNEHKVRDLAKDLEI
jgi:hypothetical protein